MSDNSIPEGREYMSSRRQGILDQLDRLERANQQGDYVTEDEIREEMDPLSVQVVRHVEIYLGIGGPTDWIDAELSEGGAINSATYHYRWGSESLDSSLSESDALYRYAEQIAEGVVTD